MSYIVVDVEADGEIPFKYSMVSFGAIIVEPSLSKTFYGKVRPISVDWKAESLAISGVTRQEHIEYDAPIRVMTAFNKWIKDNSVGTPIFISDNVAFDWQWINWYFHYYIGENPFGYSGRRLGDLYCGMLKDTHAKWKHLRDTKANHNPVNDAKGNAEVLLKMKEMGLKIKLL